MVLLVASSTYQSRTDFSQVSVSILLYSPVVTWRHATESLKKNFLDQVAVGMVLNEYGKFKDTRTA